MNRPYSPYGSRAPQRARMVPMTEVMFVSLLMGMGGALLVIVALFFVPWVRADPKNMDRWAKLLIDVATTVYKIARGAVPNPDELLKGLTGWRLLSYFTVASNAFKLLVCGGALVAVLAAARHAWALFVGTQQTLVFALVQLVGGAAALAALLLNAKSVTRLGLQPHVLVDQLLTMAAIRLDTGFWLTIAGLALIILASLVDLVAIQRGAAT